MGMGGQHHAPSASPLGQTKYHLYRGWLGHRARLGRCGKSHPPLGFDPQTVPSHSSSLHQLCCTKVLIKTQKSKCNFQTTLTAVHCTSSYLLFALCASYSAEIIENKSVSVLSVATVRWQQVVEACAELLVAKSSRFYSVELSMCLQTLWPQYGNSCSYANVVFPWNTRQ